VSLELFLALSLICAVQMILSFLVIYKFRYASLAVSSGPSTNERVNDIPIKTIQGESISLENLVQKGKEINILVVDADCRECKKMLMSSKYLNDAALSRITVIFTYNEKEQQSLNVQQISSYSWLINKYQAARTHILKHLKVHVFPYYIQIDQYRQVVYKGIASIDVILERLNVDTRVQPNIQ